MSSSPTHCHGVVVFLMFLGLRQELLLSKGENTCPKQVKTHRAPEAAQHERELQSKGEGRGCKLNNNKKNAIILLTQPSPPAQHCHCTLEATVTHCASLTVEAVLGTCFTLAFATTTPKPRQLDAVYKSSFLCGQQAAQQLPTSICCCSGGADSSFQSCFPEQTINL